VIHKATEEDGGIDVVGDGVGQADKRLRDLLLATHKGFTVLPLRDCRGDGPSHGN